MTRIISALADIAEHYDAVFCDLWGCLHNGVRAFPDAVEALRGFRAGGGTVVLLTNAPRSRHEVAKQLVRFAVPDDCWDTIATSGDSARLAMFQGAVGRKVYFIGQPHDHAFFEPLNLIGDAVDIEQVPLKEAEGIVCTGPFDPMADPETYRADFLYAKQMGMKFLCANPDIVVDRGEVREWCAGALAKLYAQMGGETLYFGKPHPGVYDLARRRLVETGQSVPDSRVLAIGDGVLTDIKGAAGEDIDALFITGGLAAGETKTIQDPEPAALKAFLEKEKTAPAYAVGFLR
jgi:HAD superfamily hydrolase (TIGR01459 family)